MAVLWFNETEKQEERISRDKREYTRFWRAKTDSLTDSWQSLLRFRPELAPFQPHPQDPLASVDRFNPVRGNLGLWDVTVEYTTDSEDEPNKNPLERPAEIETGSVERKRIRLFDAKGKPVQNTAGDWLDDPPPEIEDSDLVFSVSKNVPTRLPNWILAYRNAVNSDVIRIRSLICEPGTLKLKNLKIGKDEEENNIAFAAMTFELHHRPDGWTELIPNRGYYEKIPKRQVVNSITGNSVTVEWTRREILVEGEPAKEPQMLDREGRVIERPTLDNIIILEFDFGLRLPFSELPLK